MNSKTKTDTRRRRGFERAVSLVQTQIRQASESRGFVQSRVLTHWSEIVGPEIASTCRPVKVSYGKGGLGATLLLLTTGSHAPILQAQLPRLRDRVNAAYGYAAIAQIKLTQTAPTGFADGRVEFTGERRPDRATKISAEVAADVMKTTIGVEDTSLAEALERLGRNVLSRSKSK